MIEVRAAADCTNTSQIHDVMCMVYRNPSHSNLFALENLNCRHNLSSHHNQRQLQLQQYHRFVLGMVCPVMVSHAVLTLFNPGLYDYKVHKSCQGLMGERPDVGGFRRLSCSLQLQDLATLQL